MSLNSCAGIETITCVLGVRGFKVSTNQFPLPEFLSFQEYEYENKTLEMKNRQEPSLILKTFQVQGN